MKIPSQISTFCPNCGRHTPHSVEIYKKGKERKLAIGARRHARELLGYGGQWVAP